MKIIDTEKWARKAAYENFSKYTNPTFAMSTRLDVTKLVHYCKEHGRSFFSTFLYVLSKCANSVEEMRIRIENEGVVLFDVVHPSYVILGEDNAIATAFTTYGDSYEAFLENVRNDIEAVRQQSKDSPYEQNDRTDCIYISNMPWVDVIDCSHPYNFNDMRQSSIPRISWGKYVKVADRYEMGFNISAHHALIDGYHIALVINRISEAIENISEFLSGNDEK